jgi:hypothetical protein
MSAEAHGWAKRADVASELIRESVEVMEATDQRWDEAEIHRVRGGRCDWPATPRCAVIRPGTRGRAAPERETVSCARRAISPN